MQNHRQTPVLFGLTSLRTELRKGAHDKARKVARLLDVHASEEAAALDAWLAIKRSTQPMKGGK